MIEQFIKALYKLDEEINDEEISDIFWLALEIDATTSDENTSGDGAARQDTSQSLSDKDDDSLPASHSSQVAPPNEARAELHLQGQGVTHKHSGALSFRSPAVSNLPGSLGLARA